MIHIRRYQPRDQQAVWDLHNLALNDANAHPGSGTWDDDLHRIAEIYLNSGGEFLVGLLDDEVVAMGALKRTDNERGEIKRMRVHPAHQRKGYGRAILSALEKRAEELGFRKLHLNTTTVQLAAQRLYEESGYRRVGSGTFGQFELVLYEKAI